MFRENGKRYPCCIDGQCAAPPEDVGSTPGFERFLEIIADPKHGEYDDMMNWYLDTTAPYRDSKPYDPDRFDLAETNRWLKNQKTRKDTEANTELC